MSYQICKVFKNIFFDVKRSVVQVKDNCQIIDCAITLENFSQCLNVYFSLFIFHGKICCTLYLHGISKGQLINTLRIKGSKIKLAAQLISVKVVLNQVLILQEHKQLTRQFKCSQQNFPFDNHHPWCAVSLFTFSFYSMTKHRGQS